MIIMINDETNRLYNTVILYRWWGFFISLRYHNI